MINEDQDIDTLEHDQNEKTHPWRICPLGKHYVKTHPEHIPPSKKHPEGEIIIRHAHCADNPLHNGKRQDVLSFDEIQEMTNKYFANLPPGPPTAGALDFEHADDFDDLIRGWVCYWNGIFHLEDPLDPNFIKALIATESGFDPKTDNKVNTKRVHAHGLMQITDETRDYLSNHEGELTNYLVTLTRDNLYNPSANICAGVRWLFRKKVTATNRLHKNKINREATWEEAVIDYKGYWDDVKNGKIPSGLEHLREYYQQLHGQ